MTIYLAKELRSKLNNLTLVGENDDGELEWVGTNKQWLKAIEDESIDELYEQYN